MHVLLQVLLGVVGVSVTLVLALLAKVYHDHGYWKRRGMPTIPSTTPLLGNFGEVMNKSKAFTYVVQDFHTTTKKMDCKFAGIYIFTRPSLWLVDLDIIRDVTVRHFDHFSDRKPLTDKSADELLGRSLLSLQGDEWRDMRHTLSPAFTGAKLRGMVPLMESTCQQLADFLVHRNSEESLDVHETMRRFAADVIASTAFGTVSDALHNEHDDFYNYGITLMDMSGKRAFVMMGYFLSPWLMQKLGIPFVPQALTDFFLRTINTTIKYRQSENVSRTDMIQLLLDARQNQKVDISDVDIVAHAFTFFLAGFDTIAATLSFTMQLLAMHPEIQAKLRVEVDEAFERGQGKLGYELVHSLNYMEMVISEVLRLYPAAPMVDRLCTKSFELPEHGLHVEKGMQVGFSIYGLHHDPEYFPDPERFDPERFNEENKSKLKSFTYMPFGSGPRNCIGGFDTIAAALSFCVQLLAMHPEVQAKLRDEVDEAFERGHGQLGYELMHSLSYMDMVINEVMRLYPAAPMVDRMCTKSFELPEHGLHVEKGTPVGFSIYGLHHDPEYFSDPERFDPERFSEENNDKMKPFTFLPFGSGPRNCIGIRFAQLEMKLALAYVIAAVELEVCERTTIPLVISAESSQMKPAGGFWVTSRPRTNKPWVHAES